MLASFLASNYAFYAASQGYTQGLVYPTYVDPQLVGYSTVAAKESEHIHMTPVTSKTVINTPENFIEASRKSSISQKSLKDSNLVKFSIARILGETSSTESKEDAEEDNDDVINDATSDVAEENLQYSWLHCTRYKPPKLQRIRKRECTKKRKLGRNPRVPFTQQQVAALEQKFFRTHYLSSMDVAELSTALNLTETRVKIWFQNRRARERREREARQRDGNVRKSQPIEKSWTISPSLPSQSNSSVTRIQDTLYAGQSAFKPVRLQNYKDT